MDWKISSSVCVLCSRVSQFYINKWVLYAWVVGWSHVCMHTWRAQKATELIMCSSFQFIAGWNCYVSETDSSDMVTVPVVFVSSQLIVIRDMTEASVFTTKKKKILCTTWWLICEWCNKTQTRWVLSVKTCALLLVFVWHQTKIFLHTFLWCLAM